MTSDPSKPHGQFGERVMEAGVARLEASHVAIVEGLS